VSQVAPARAIGAAGAAQNKKWRPDGRPDPGPHAVRGEHHLPYPVPHHQHRAGLVAALLSLALAAHQGRPGRRFGTGWNYPVFAAAIAIAVAVAIAIALPMACVLMGATWLVMKTEGELQERAVQWARTAWTPMVGGMLLISMVTPWVSAEVRARWFALPEMLALAAIPLMTGVALLAVRGLLHTRMVRGPLCWLPFALLIFVFVLGFLGLAFSIFPYVVIGQLTIWQAASSPAALKVILVGACISVPAIVGYTVFSYRVFRGKTGELRYA
jgi:cytochrome d ubiquinol oxidase subunit II